MKLAENPLKSGYYNIKHMFNNIKETELFVVLMLILTLLFASFLLTYFLGLSKGRKEHFKPTKYEMLFIHTYTSNCGINDRQNGSIYS